VLEQSRLDQQYGPLADWLAENGVASWNVDYRELKTGGGWPQTFVDWAGALSQLQTLAASHALDLERITVIGHSSGTLPAVWLGMEGRGDAIVSDNIPMCAPRSRLTARSRSMA
jgi:acetyl esterase/lipase